MTQYHARRLPLHRGPAAWDAILPPRIAGPALTEDTDVDFAIIGGGFAGVAAARRLAQLAPDARIAVLEAGHVAQGASGRNSGFMIDLPHDLKSENYAGPQGDLDAIGLNRRAIAFARDAVADYEIDHNFFDPVGKINGAASPAAHANNAQYAAHLEGLGEVFEHLDAQQMQEITGSTYYVSGLFSPGTVMLQPAGYMRGIVDGLRRDGVMVFENTPVTAFKQDRSGWCVTSPQGSLRTDKIILTVNGHLESFGHARGRLMQLFLFATMTPDLDLDAVRGLGGHSRWGITPADPMGTTLRRIDTGQGGNRIVTRTCAALRSGTVAKPSDLRRAVKIMRRKFDSRFPQLAKVEMEHAWAGHLCLSMNGASVTREIDKGVYAGCVQNGLGTARGTLTGIAAAELACGVQSDITRHFVNEPAPSRLPPPSVRDLSANAVLRWKEWKARAE
ncbi:MAG: NAD(P)/FAD-dependent oxidoreductase [Sulfitobacter sp.]